MFSRVKTLQIEKSLREGLNFFIIIIILLKHNYCLIKFHSI